MTCYIISYKLADETSEDKVIEAIKSYTESAQILEDTWAVVTDDEATDIRDHLKSIIDLENDKIFIIKSGAEAGWANVICEKSWLHKYLMNEY